MADDNRNLAQSLDFSLKASLDGPPLRGWFVRLLQSGNNRLALAAGGIRAWLLRFSGVRCERGICIGSNTEISLGSAPARRGEIVLGERSRIERGAILHPYGGVITVGQDVFIGPYTVIYGHGGVLIGKDTLISMHCRILSSNHALPPAGTIIRSQPDELRPTRIGADVWLGAGVTVLGGVTLGDGCVVGAGAVVTGDLPPFAIAVGIPARVTGKRT